VKKIISILQPGYLPWSGFFEQLHRSDVFVLYDDVQYTKNDWRNRNRIKTAQGVKWLTVPVRSKSSFLIKDVSIDGTQWQRKHIKTITQNYSKAPFFEHYSVELFDLLKRSWKFLVDLNFALIKWFAEKLEILTPIKLSSDLNIVGSKVARLIKIIHKFDGNRFYEGFSGKNYIDEEVFKRKSISIVFQDYACFEYPQLFGPFVPFLSVLDLLFNCGRKSLEYIIKGSKDVKSVF